MKTTLVKVCCISSLEEAHLALNEGADLLGFVSEMPNGPGIISLDSIHLIISQLPRKTKTVLLTSKVSAVDIIRQHKTTPSWGIQLVDRVPETELRLLREALPETTLIGVVHVRDHHSIKEAVTHSTIIDLLLLDSGSPGGPNRTLGGTGETHDWQISHQICEQVSIPVLLAGGLNPQNVSLALSTVKPTGVDACSGLRVHGHLDQHLTRSFLQQVKQWSLPAHHFTNRQELN